MNGTRRLCEQKVLCSHSSNKWELQRASYVYNHAAVYNHVGGVRTCREGTAEAEAETSGRGGEQDNGEWGYVRPGKAQLIEAR
jgi:hypothetical protein